MNVHAKIGILWSSDGNRENGHSFIFHTKREFYVLQMYWDLNSCENRACMYSKCVRSLFRRSFLLFYSSDDISAVSRFGFTNRTLWKRADYLLSSHLSFAQFSKMTIRCLFSHVRSYAGSNLGIPSCHAYVLDCPCLLLLSLIAVAPVVLER
jgi:hypothetical protein